MKLFKLTFVAVALLSFVLACSSSPNNQAIDMRPQTTPTSAAKAPTPAPTAAPDELAGAAADYANFCARCHKADGTGGPFKIEEENKTIKVPNLRENGRKDPDAQIAKQIHDGGKEMPPFKKRLDDERINNLVRYIRREFHGQTPGAGGNTSPTPAR
jgi:mono/diheme cytochrome c family protein